MPPLKGFSDNPFTTRDDVIRGTKALIKPLHTYKSPLGARIKLPIDIGTHFDETAAQLEGFARPLWAVGCLLSEHLAESNTEEDTDELRDWPRGLIAGTNPELLDEYWGDVEDIDQRMVEMEIISFALLSAPSAFWPSASPEASPEEFHKVKEQRAQIVKWLQGINGKAIPKNNWLWFRVLTNLALVKTCQVPYSSLSDAIAADLTMLDSFERDGNNGWNSDGLWDDNGKQADYYSGSFAIQYSQLLFVRFGSDLDPIRAEKYCRRAGQFAIDFMSYFSDDGAAIPFGRSLTYRFAMGAFWSAVAFAEVKLPAPLDSLGTVKGMLLRHLRHWASKASIFHADGTLNIGFEFPNAYLSEDYNSPQSVYWCLKALIPIALPKSHEFWTCEELPHPLSNNSFPQVKEMEGPLQITCKSHNHHYMLSTGQFCGWPIKATEAKYAKFAYSSSFGFSVPTGPLIQQIAPDSTLALSNDEEDSWKVRWKSTNARIGIIEFENSNGVRENVPVLQGMWNPWKVDRIDVDTILIPPTSRWPDWHVRIHIISFRPDHTSLGTKHIIGMEGGFAIRGREKQSGLGVQVLKPDLQKHGKGELATEGKLAEPGMALILSAAGASGIRNLGTDVIATGIALKPDSNTNLISQRTLIPLLKYDLHLTGDRGVNTSVLITGVFAVAAKENGMIGMTSAELKERWEDVPIVTINSKSSREGYHVDLTC